MLAFLAVVAGYSAQLKPETLHAWNDYVQEQNRQVRQRVESHGKFLWADEDEVRSRQLRSGLIVIEPMHNRSSVKAGGGLIHHWIGAAFIPDASAIDVMAVTRDYVHYNQYYKPGVADAKPLRLHESRDEFTVRFVNSSVLSKTSLEGQYVSDYVQVSDKRWYSVSLTTRMQEIKDFGQPDEKRLPEDEGSGYIWRLYSTTRLEERDGGVIVEIEAVVLSRDVPRLLHVIADPIIRRVSRDSMNRSLENTACAVRARNNTILRTSR